MSETQIEQGTQVLGEEPNAAPQPATDDAPTTGQEQEADPEQQPEKPKQTPWFQRRIDELTREKHDARREAEAFAARLRQIEQGQQGQPQQTPPPGYVPATEVERAAAAMVEARAFNEACDAIADEVSKFGDLQTAQRTFQMLGGVPAPFLEAVVSLGKEDGARVYADLGSNPDEAERILKLSPARMAVELARMAAKPRTPPVSKAPPPVRPVGSGSTRNASLETMDDASFRAEFAKQWRARQYG